MSAPSPRSISGRRYEGMNSRIPSEMLARFVAQPASPLDPVASWYTRSTASDTWNSVCAQGGCRTVVPRHRKRCTEHG